MKESLLLLFLAFAAFFALFGEEFALGLEPNPAALDVAGCVLHGHFLANLGLFLRLVLALLLLALLPLLGVHFDLLHDRLNLFVRARLPLLDFVSFSLDTRNLCIFLGLLVFVLLLEEGDTLLQMHLDCVVHLFLGREHVAQLLNLLLQLRLFLLVQAVLA